MPAAFATEHNPAAFVTEHNPIASAVEPDLSAFAARRPDSTVGALRGVPGSERPAAVPTARSTGRSLP